MKLLFATPLLALTIASAQSPPALSLRDYQAQLDRWSERTARLEKNPREAAALRRDLPASWIVRNGSSKGSGNDAQRWNTPTAWLDEALASIEKDGGAVKVQVPVILARLKALHSAAASLESGAPGGQVSRSALREILARPEFNPQETWFDRMRQKAEEWLIKALDWIAKRLRLPRMPDVSPPFLRILVAALILGLIYFLSRRLLFRAGPPQTAVPEAVPESRRAWLDYGSRAARAAEAGDHREAIRLAYWAGIYRLEELGVWHAESTRTHREYLRMIPERSLQRAPLTAITQTFELSWYGGQPASEDEYQDVTHHLEEMGCQLPSNPRTASS
jgi:hypothetical protein